MAMRWSLSYAEAESVLARLHGALGDVQKNAFRGRLKHLKRLGIPLNSSPGRGSKIYYFEDELFQWAFSLELAEFGIDPTSIARFMQSEWKNILPQFQKAREAPARGDEIFFIMNPRLISDAWAPKPFDYEWIKVESHAKLLRRLTSSKRRAILINISELAREIGQGAIAFHSARHVQKETED